MTLFRRTGRGFGARSIALVVFAATTFAGCGKGKSALDLAVEKEKQGKETEGKQVAKTGVDDLKAKPAPVEETVDWPKNPGYAGVDSCVECHKERAADFRETRHALACRRPEPDEMAPGFAPGKNLIASQLPGVRFEMSRRVDDFFVTITREGRGGKAVKDDRKIDFVYGLGQPTDEGYFSFDGEYLYELPVSWMPERKEWGVTYFDAPSDGKPGRATQFRCMECHNTWFSHRPGTENRFNPHSFMLGVQCESCHGPSQKHVDHHRQDPNDKTGRHVIVPTSLDRDRQVDLCASCHSNALFHKTEPLSFRPGDKLDDHIQSLTLRHPEHNHVANQTDYMKQSKCFQNSDMTCVTCHNPHLSRERQDASGCAKCHQNEACKERSRLPEGVRDSCVACHMPTRIKIQVAFNTATDRHVSPVPRWEHRVAVYPEARDETLWKWFSQRTTAEDKREAERLRKSLAEYWSRERDARLAEHRLMAAIECARQAIRFDDSEDTAKALVDILAAESEINKTLRRAGDLSAANRLDGAKAAFERVVELDPTQVDAVANLGTVMARLGDMEKAKELWNKARAIDPDEKYSLSMLAWESFLDGNVPEALRKYEELVALAPSNAKPYVNWGIVLADEGRHEEALEKFVRAEKLDAFNGAILEHQAKSLRALGRTEEAYQRITAAHRLSEGPDPKILLALAEICYESGRIEEGDAVARAFLSLASQGVDPAKLAELEQRLLKARERKK